MKMDFPEALSEKLIVVVEKYDILYNMTNKDYRNTRERALVWEKVADEILDNAVCQVYPVLEGEQCRKAWDVLRAKYRAAVEEERLGKPSGSGRGRPRHEFPFKDQMSFIRPYVKKRRGKTNIELKVRSPERPTCNEFDSDPDGSPVLGFDSADIEENYSAILSRVCEIEKSINNSVRDKNTSRAGSSKQSSTLVGMVKSTSNNLKRFDIFSPTSQNPPFVEEESETDQETLDALKTPKTIAPKKIINRKTVMVHAPNSSEDDDNARDGTEKENRAKVLPKKHPARKATSAKRKAPPKERSSDSDVEIINTQRKKRTKLDENQNDTNRNREEAMETMMKAKAALYENLNNTANARKNPPEQKTQSRSNRENFERNVLRACGNLVKELPYADSIRAMDYCFNYLVNQVRNIVPNDNDQII